jgi:hypothetical protein
MHTDLARMRKPAKNNFACESVVKRDKRTWDAGALCESYTGAGASACVSVPTTSVKE